MHTHIHALCQGIYMAQHTWFAIDGATTVGLGNHRLDLVQLRCIDSSVTSPSAEYFRSWGCSLKESGNLSHRTSDMYSCSFAMPGCWLSCSETLDANPTRSRPVSLSTCPTRAFNESMESKCAHGVQKRHFKNVMPLIRRYVTFASGHKPWFQSQTKDKYHYSNHCDILYNTIQCSTAIRTHPKLPTAQQQVLQTKKIKVAPSIESRPHFFSQREDHSKDLSASLCRAQMQWPWRAAACQEWKVPFGTSILLRLFHLLWLCPASVAALCPPPVTIIAKQHDKHSTV